MMKEKDGSETLFYDTYALYAIAIGQESYKIFNKNHKILTCLMNLYELYYLLIKENKEELTEEFFKRLMYNCVEISAECIKEAAKFRFKEIKKKMSYLDCLGYVLARENNVKFLTGDIAFKDLPNVEFVH